MPHHNDQVSRDLARMLADTVTTTDHLERIVGTPHPAVAAKHTTVVTPLVREFITQARFFVLATADAQGNCDSSPRGDVQSVVLFPDERTLVLPDRPGNRRTDSYRNILDNPHVGIVFIVPGNDEVVRVNGRAALTVDPRTLDALAVAGKPATLAVVVQVDQVFTHCARAILRAGLFDPNTWPDLDTVPTNRAMGEEIRGTTPTSHPYPARQEPYRTHLY